MTIRTLDIAAWRAAYLNAGSSTVNRMSTEADYQAYAQRVAASNADVTATVAAASSPFKATAIYAAVTSSRSPQTTIARASSTAAVPVAVETPSQKAASEASDDMSTYLTHLKALMSRYV